MRRADPKTSAGFDFGVDVDMGCRVVTDDDDRQVGLNPRYGQVSHTLEQFGFNGVCARFAVDLVCCHVLANGRVDLRIGMRTASSQRRFETQCTHNAPSCSGLPDGKGSAKHGTEDGVPAESKGDGSGGEKPGENQGAEDAGHSTEESGQLPPTVDVTLQHGLRWVFPYMKRCFLGWVEPTEGLEPPTV